MIIIVLVVLIAIILTLSFLKNKDTFYITSQGIYNTNRQGEENNNVNQVFDVYTSNQVGYNTRNQANQVFNGGSTMQADLSSINNIDIPGFTSYNQVFNGGSTMQADLSSISNIVIPGFTSSINFNNVEEIDNLIEDIKRYINPSYDNYTFSIPQDVINETISVYINVGLDNYFNSNNYEDATPLTILLNSNNLNGHELPRIFNGNYFSIMNYQVIEFEPQDDQGRYKAKYHHIHRLFIKDWYSRFDNNQNIVPLCLNKLSIDIETGIIEERNILYSMPYFSEYARKVLNGSMLGGVTIQSDMPEYLLSSQNNQDVNYSDRQIVDPVRILFLNNLMDWENQDSIFRTTFSNDFHFKVIESLQELFLNDNQKFINLLRSFNGNGCNIDQYEYVYYNSGIDKVIVYNGTHSIISNSGSSYTNNNPTQNYLNIIRGFDSFIFGGSAHNTFQGFFEETGSSLDVYSLANIERTQIRDISNITRDIVTMKRALLSTNILSNIFAINEIQHYIQKEYITYNGALIIDEDNFIEYVSTLSPNNFENWKFLRKIINILMCSNNNPDWNNHKNYMRNVYSSINDEISSVSQGQLDEYTSLGEDLAPELENTNNIDPAIVSFFDRFSTRSIFEHRNPRISVDDSRQAIRIIRHPPLS